MGSDHITETDILIASAGPAGLAFANHVAETGLSVVVIDSREETGQPLRCVEVTRPVFFDHIGIESRGKWIRWKLKDTPEKMVVLNRALFESDMTKILSQKGVKIIRNTSVTGVDRYNGKGRFIRLSRGREESRIFAGLVVAADGISSQVARLSGIDTHLSPEEVLPCLSYRCDGVELKHGYHAETERPDYLKPGFFWIVPTGKNQANVGLSIKGTHGHQLPDILDSRMKSNPAFANARIIEKIVGCYPFSMPLETPFSDALMVVGTAARLVDSGTGEGILYAAESGKIAAQTYISAKFDNCTGSLSGYRQRLDPMVKVLQNIYSGTSS